MSTWTQIQSFCNYTSRGVRGTIGLSLIKMIKNHNLPVKSGNRSIWNVFFSFFVCLFVLFLVIVISLFNRVIVFVVDVVSFERY